MPEPEPEPESESEEEKEAEKELTAATLAAFTSQIASFALSNQKILARLSDKVEASEATITRSEAEQLRVQRAHASREQFYDGCLDDSDLAANG